MLEYNYVNTIKKVMRVGILHDCHLGERPGPDEEVYERGVE